jgi:hypothetical protein
LGEGYVIIGIVVLAEIMKAFHIRIAANGGVIHGRYA